MLASMIRSSRCQAMALAMVPLVALSFSPKPSADSAGRPSRVEFREVRVFPHHFLAYGQPWSPTHERLVMQGGEGLSVYDATRPQSGLHQIFKGAWVRQVTWSPDGDWLLLVIGDPNPTNTRTLIAVPWQGGTPDTLVEDEAFFPAIWASDGNVAYLTGSIVHWIRPRHGSDPPPMDPRDAPSLVTRHGEGGMNLQWIRPGKLETEPLAIPVRGYHILIADAVPRLGRYLIRGIAADSASMLILNAHGGIDADLGAAGIPFEPSGLSGDGSLVIGYKEIDDGHTISSSKMYVASSRGAWSARVEKVNAAVKACFARTGRTIAYEDPIVGGVHVGSLSFEP